MIYAYLDRQTKTWALLSISDGRVYDVNGVNWAELRAEALALAEELGVQITSFNSDLPEE